MIHSLPQEQWVVAVRPFLNFCVALFIFISGYLTPEDKVANTRAFLKKRIGKVAAPYIVWTSIYLIMRQDFGVMSFVKGFALGGSAQLYYLLVYIQLVALTPVLYRLLDYRTIRIVLYLVTPCLLVLRSLLTASGIALPHVQAFCGMWLIYYLLGLEWRRRYAPALWRTSLSERALATALFLVFQLVAGFAWYSAGNFDLATSQMKISSMVSSLGSIMLLMTLPDAVKKRTAAGRLFSVLGDLSFGIYLAHLIPIVVLNHFGLTGGMLFLIEWLVALFFSALAVRLCQSLLPTRFCALIGFA